jgi:uncharacterized membrane protein
VISVAVIDKLAILFTAILAFLFLSEKITFASGIGLVLIAVGTVLVAIPFKELISIFK